MSSANNPLERLIGLTAVQATKLHDYLQLKFSDGTILNINNRYKLVGTSDGIECVIGKLVSGVKADERSIRIVFFGGMSLLVGLNEEDFNSPEAMEMYAAGSPPIIWN